MRKLVILLGAILANAFSRQLVDEFKAWVPSLTRSLISLGACILPQTERARRIEEWASHLEEIPGEISKILVAIGFIAAGFWIRYESRDRIGIALKTWENAKNQVVFYVFLANLLTRLWVHRGLVWIGLSHEQPTTTPEATQAMLAVLLLVCIYLSEIDLLARSRRAIWSIARDEC